MAHCGDKVKYSTILEAEKSARVHLFTYKEDKKPYKCTKCGFFHIGERHREINKYRAKIANTPVMVSVETMSEEMKAMMVLFADTKTEIIQCHKKATDAYEIYKKKFKNIKDEAYREVLKVACYWLERRDLARKLLPKTEENDIWLSSLGIEPNKYGTFDTNIKLKGETQDILLKRVLGIK